MEKYSLLVSIYKKTSNKKIRRFIFNYISKIEGGTAFSNTIRTIYKVVHKIEIGYGTYGGCFNYINIPEGVIFGNYCSIAPNIKVFRANHPIKSFTTHPLIYNPEMGFVQKDKLIRPQLIVGHDVWIGENVIILPKVNRIGNGAIIGAGSVVTKDVLAYSIIAGNPARIIGMRFKEQCIEKLEASQWFYLSKSELEAKIEELSKIVSQE